MKKRSLRKSVRGSLDSGARSGRASPADPLAMIHQVAKPEDFVAMKVDIDGGPELELVTRVADNEGGVADLIDELYFEYHFFNGQSSSLWSGAGDIQCPYFSSVFGG